MKSLLLLRHAKSSWENIYLADHDRPLSKRGEQDAPRMGRLLKAEDLVPDLIITSTAKRALATAEAVALAADYEAEIKYTRRLYHADPETYLELLQELPDEYERVMLVGHNPGMEELIEDLTGFSERFTTANVAHVRLPIDSWQALTADVAGELLHLWRPKEL